MFIFYNFARWWRFFWFRFGIVKFSLKKVRNDLLIETFLVFCFFPFLNKFEILYIEFYNLNAMKILCNLSIDRRVKNFIENSYLYKQFASALWIFQKNCTNKWFNKFPRNEICKSLQERKTKDRFHKKNSNLWAKINNKWEHYFLNKLQYQQTQHDICIFFYFTLIYQMFFHSKNKQNPTNNIY